METQKFSYDNNIVRAFLYATIVFGIAGFILGLTAALMLFYPELPEFLFGTDDTTIQSLKSGNIQGLINTQGALGFGRIRMMHTNTVIWAFVCNSFFLCRILQYAKATENQNVQRYTFMGTFLDLADYDCCKLGYFCNGLQHFKRIC